MRRYDVFFYYGTDLRDSGNADAYNEIQALALVMAERKIESWLDSNDKNFRIEITRH